MCQLSVDHESVVGFVVQFHALQKVLNGTDILLLLDLAVDGQELIGLNLLLACSIKSKHNDYSSCAIKLSCKRCVYPSS